MLSKVCVCVCMCVCDVEVVKFQVSSYIKMNELRFKFTFDSDLRRIIFCDCVFVMHHKPELQIRGTQFGRICGDDVVSSIYV